MVGARSYKLATLFIFLLTFGVSTFAAGSNPIEPGLELVQSVMRVESKQGETETFDLQVNNTSGSPQSVTIDVKGLEDFLIVTEPSFTIEPHESKNVTLVFKALLAHHPKVETGTVILKVGSSYKQIKILSKILEKKSSLM